jgi:hypothetical protein
MLERFRPSNPPATADAPARKAVRTAAPILLRFVGCADEPVAVNSELFTLGDGAEDTVLLPPALRRSGSIKLRFTRGPEGWRIAAADHRVFYVNQNVCRGLTVLESGDVVRLEPGGTGVQFLVRSQFDAASNKKTTEHPKAGSTESSKDLVRTLRALPVRGMLIALAVLAAMGLAYYAGVSSAPTPAPPPVSDQP